MARRLFITLVAVALIVPLGSSVAAPSDKTWKQVRKAMAGVPCEAEGVTETETSSNMKLLAQVPWPIGLRAGELDVDGDVAVGHLVSPLSGLMTFDLSNPLKPRHLATAVFDPERATYDAKITPDGKTAISGFERPDTVVLGRAGVAMANIEDPSRPTYGGEWESPRQGPTQNAHMTYVAKIDGTVWVFIAPNEGTGVWILKMTGPPNNRKLEYVTSTLPVEGGPLGPHDIWVTYDNDLDRWLLYAADGWHGWMLFDVTDPSTPAFMGGFVHPSSGYTHTVQAAKIDERRIVVTIEEVGGNFMKVYDATNLQAPILLGVWSTRQGSGPASAQHNIQIVGNYLYVAHYARGIYVFDLAAIGTTPLAGTQNLVPIAHYMGEGGASFWDVVVENGLLYLTDFNGNGGLHVVGFGCNTPGDKRLTSTG